MTRPDDGPEGDAVLPPGGLKVESIIVALITGGLSLVGVFLSNTKASSAMEVRLEELTKQVEKHNQLVERAYKLEQEVAVAPA